jgi:hypothetical protein
MSGVSGTVDVGICAKLGNIANTLRVREISSFFILLFILAVNNTDYNNLTLYGPNISYSMDAPAL